MNNDELFEKLKQNILSVHWSMDDAPYHGFTGDKIRGVEFAIKRILDGTGITIGSLVQEMHEKKWFEYKPK